VPVLSFAAWYDIFLGGSLKNFVRLKRKQERKLRSAGSGWQLRSAATRDSRVLEKSARWSLAISCRPI